MKFVFKTSVRRNVESNWSKFVTGNSLMLKTLNPEILKNSPGRIRVVKKEVRVGWGSGYSTMPASRPLGLPLGPWPPGTL